MPLDGGWLGLGFRHNLGFISNMAKDKFPKIFIVRNKSLFAGFFPKVCLQVEAEWFVSHGLGIYYSTNKNIGILVSMCIVKHIWFFFLKKVSLKLPSLKRRPNQ